MNSHTRSLSNYLHHLHERNYNHVEHKANILVSFECLLYNQVIPWRCLEQLIGDTHLPDLQNVVKKLK